MGGMLARPDQVVHFSCHCKAGSGAAWHDYELQLAADPLQQPQSLKLWDLHNEIRRAQPWNHADRSRTMPLVFINACTSAIVDPRSAASILTPFAKNENRALIGTMALVEDQVAARFSRCFYQFLFSGECVGAALRRARWQLLSDGANPLGILYVHFGDAGLRVVPIIAAVNR
jgi:CHAT domain-containing protein